jgi:hypothetical protein
MPSGEYGHLSVSSIIIPDDRQRGDLPAIPARRPSKSTTIFAAARTLRGRRSGPATLSASIRATSLATSSSPRRLQRAMSR